MASMRREGASLAGLFLLAVFSVLPGDASDWPHWLGPNSNGVSSETGLINSFPSTGPEVLWETTIGNGHSGYAGLSIVNGRVYTMLAESGKEAAVCMDASSGKRIWLTPLDANYRNPKWGDGPRSQPTVDGNSVYFLGGNGSFICADTATGKVRWRTNFKTTYGVRLPHWGFAGSPVIEGGILYCQASGRLFAFNKKDGKLVWKTNGGRDCYATPILITLGGQRHLVYKDGQAIIGLSPTNGKPHWKYNMAARIDIPTPILGPGNLLFISSGYNWGSAMLKLSFVNGMVRHEEVYRKTMKDGGAISSHHANPVLYKGNLYGFHRNNAVQLKCVDFKSGEEKWATRDPQKGALIAADGKLIILNEIGELILAKATPAKYQQLARASVLHGKCWTFPVLANGRLYVRNESVLKCLKFK